MKAWERCPWAEQYRIAILELDRNKLPDRIELAKAAIWSRLAELGSREGNRELGPLYDALKMLRLLEGELKNEQRPSGASSRRARGKAVGAAE